MTIPADTPLPMRKPARRGRRTRRMLADALVALILEKGYDAVTIEDITERADLGRTTFYLHYKDKDDLLLERIDEIASDLTAQINQRIQERETRSLKMFDPENPEDNAPVVFLFRHAYENADFYRVILRGEGAARASRMFRSTVNAYLDAYFQKVFTPKPSIPTAVLTNYFSGALLALLTWWLENNMPYPVEDMATMFRRLFFQGCGWAFDFD